MKLKNMRLTLASVAKTPDAKSMEVNAVGKVYKRDKQDNPTSELDYVYADCGAIKGDFLRVKFPKELESKINDLRSLLDDDVPVNITFEKLKLFPYALRTDEGQLLSGVSAKADDFTIVSPAVDDIDDAVIM